MIGLLNLTVAPVFPAVSVSVSRIYRSHRVSNYVLGHLFQLSKALVTKWRSSNHHFIRWFILSLQVGRQDCCCCSSFKFKHLLKQPAFTRLRMQYVFRRWLTAPHITLDEHSSNSWAVATYQRIRPHQNVMPRKPNPVTPADIQQKTDSK